MHDVLVLVMKLVVCALLLPNNSYLAIQVKLDVRLPQKFPRAKLIQGGVRNSLIKHPEKMTICFWKYCGQLMWSKSTGPVL